ncbi:DUF4238 domain-containing protein [Luteimonas gilva]|uniref:DUF4238 domain-containing protein n=1 Tax=Luteimonas gilva TaxID=2572684 RepID=UPI001673CF60|nr:DUF4238 domain-containing protein [Luteimonas gilva]
MTAKRHHYVPEAYLRAFTDGDGRLTVFRKDAPSTPFRTSPSDVALEQYYYAFTRSDEVRDTDSFEQIFSDIESGWPEIINRLKSGDVSDEVTHDLLQFACLQRARVPAVRDAYEIMRADSVGHIARLLQRMGKLPDAPPDSKDILDRVEISIDPESSLEAIALTLDGMVERVLPTLGFRIIHNRTRISFVTSDNPVMWFIPYKNENEIKPYEMIPGAPMEFLFPLTPRLILLGTKQHSTEFREQGLLHGTLTNLETVKRANRLIAKFAYNAVFSEDESPSALVKKYADVSPVAHSTSFPRPDGDMIMVHMEFSSRRTKAKWHQPA